MRSAENRNDSAMEASSSLLMWVMPWRRWSCLSHWHTRIRSWKFRKAKRKRPRWRRLKKGWSRSWRVSGPGGRTGRRLAHESGAGDFVRVVGDADRGAMVLAAGTVLNPELEVAWEMANRQWQMVKARVWKVWWGATGKGEDRKSTR